MHTAFCPNCEKSVRAAVQTKREVYNVRGEAVEVDADVFFCRECGTAIFDEGLDATNLNKAYDRYRENHGLLSPGRIRSLRESYGLSQRALSVLLGWGEITLHRYENGAIQDNAHDITLRFLEEPENMRRLLQTNRSRLSVVAAARLAERIQENLREDSERAFQLSYERLVSHQSADVTSGFTTYDLEKFESMVLHLLERLGSVLKTKLNKLTWYCDFLHFKETSVSITGTRYACLPYGPVPDNYELIIANMIREGLIEKSEIAFDTARGVTGEQFAALVKPDDALFTAMEVRVIDAVADAFREYTSTAITEKSHQELAYKECGNGDMVSYEHATALSLSLPDAPRKP